MSLFDFKHHGLAVCIWPNPSEDGEEAVASFSKSIESQGYRVREAVSTPQGIKLIARRRPDLVYVHNDPSMLLTLTEDGNFAAHYRPKPGSHLEAAVLFERQ